MHFHRLIKTPGTQSSFSFKQPEGDSVQWKTSTSTMKLDLLSNLHIILNQTILEFSKINRFLNTLKHNSKYKNKLCFFDCGISHNNVGSTVVVWTLSSSRYLQRTVTCRLVEPLLG
jgi:hypothetical protein